MADYSGDISPTLLPQYDALIRQGLPPNVAYSILTQRSYAEGEKPPGAGPWGSYSGWQEESRAARSAPPRDQALSQQMWNQRETQQQNLPTWENHTPGEDDNLGFTRLPSGQYVPGWQHSSFQGGAMPPWNQMSPQQQQLLLQMMMSRGTAGMQFGGAMGANPGAQLPMAGMPGAITPLQTTPGFNPLANQAQNQMNPMMLQYLMGLQNQGGGGMQQPTLAQLLQMRGTGMGL